MILSVISSLQAEGFGCVVVMVCVCTTVGVKKLNPKMVGEIVVVVLN
jgi:hypothetical protein